MSHTIALGIALVAPAVSIRPVVSAAVVSRRMSERPAAAGDRIGAELIAR